LIHKAQRGFLFFLMVDRGLGSADARKLKRNNTKTPD